ILTARLRRACPINSRQRGFIAAPDCVENLKLLRMLIKYAKKEHKSLGVVFVDLAKAFDSVHHQHIFQVLRQKDVDGRIINIIAEMYNNSATRLE
ncbi:PO21 protein, partial [Casuarius casuarius]|nr:PO21 protein [Casuarius casuarius]